MRLFELIKSKALEFGFVFNPPKFNVDFESATIEAIKVEFSQAEIKGCLYHFSQCILRRVQAMGFASNYRQDCQVRRWIRLAVALALLPEENIDDGFNLLQDVSRIQF